MYGDGRFSRQLLSGPHSDTRSFKLMGVEARELLAQFHLPLPLLRRLLSFSKVYLDAYTGLWMHSSSSSFSTCGCRTATKLASVGSPAATSLHFTTNVTCEFLAQFCVFHHHVQTYLRFRLLYFVLALGRAFLNRLLFMYVVVGNEMGDGRLSYVCSILRVSDSWCLRQKSGMVRSMSPVWGTVSRPPLLLCGG